MNEFELVYEKIKIYFKTNSFFKNEYIDSYLKNYSNTLSSFISSLNDFDYYNSYFFSLLSLHSYLYKVYSEDIKINSIEIDSRDIFETFFIEKFSKSIESKIEKNWVFSPENQLFRKTGKNVKNKEGRYLLANETIDPNNTNAADFNNFTHNLTQEGYLNNYFWVYGKCFRTIGASSRFYLNFLPNKELIYEFIYTLSCNLNESQIPFSLKFLADPEIYLKKSDVSVLYVGRHHTFATIMVLTRIYKEFKNKNFFLQEKPLFSHTLNSGISFGEDPDDERFESFGSYRCAYITLAMYEIWKEGNIHNFTIIDLKDKLNRFQNLVKEIVPGNENLLTGNWTDHFFLNKYSNYHYENELQYLLKNFKKQPSNLLSEIKKNIYSKSALKIAFILTSNAIWYESEIDSNRNQYLECNWASFSKQTFMNNEAQMLKEIEYKMLDTSFENGKLGVSFFLKKMYDLNKEYYREFDTTFYRATKKQIFRKEKNLSDIEKWFVYNTNYHYFRDRHKLKSIIPSVISIQRKNNLKNLDLIKFLDSIICQDQGLDNLINQNSELIEKFEILLNLFLEEDKPFDEISQTKEFKVDLNLGLTYIGYACLRLYDAKKYPSLPLNFNYID
jgi:hypothetical protein